MSCSYCSPRPSVSDCKAVVKGLPSYTQLGMAALLPNSDLQISDVSKGDVQVDGKPSAGLENRRKILKAAMAAEEKNWNADARSASEVLEMHKDAVRELFRDNNVIYIYQDIIDSTAHSTKSEDRAF